MKVIGIDPGTAACGYGIVQEKGGRVRAIDYGWWKTPATDRPEARLKTIFDAVTTLIDQAAPDAVALEESFVGVDARTRPPFSWTMPYPHAAVPGSMPRTFTGRG